MNLLGKNVVVYGGGISGLSAYELVKSKGGRCIIYDDNPKVEHATSSTGVFASADIIVLSPGIDVCNEMLLDLKLEGKIIIGEIELASSFCNAEQIAVTGTNGKTTTVSLIDHILKNGQVHSHAVGNIGVAFSSICDQLDSLEVAVIEVSSFQLESTIHFAPDIAVLLNITPDHLNRHKTMQKYISAKSNIFLRQCACDKIVYNDDDEIVKSLVPYMVAQKIPFSMTHPVDGAYLSSNVICYKGLPIVDIEDINLQGREIENALASVAVCMSRGISAFTVSSALCTFKRPHFRREKVAEIDGISIYDDSKATNVSATLSAIESTVGDMILIVGGQDIDDDYSLIFSNKNSIVSTIAVGENATKIKYCAKQYGYENCIVACDLESAVDMSIDIAKKQGVNNILFSPASKSFDCYSGYEERGKYFDKIVKSKR